MSTVRALALLFIVAMLANCHGPAEDATLDLQEIQTYGEEGAQAGAIAGGGMLSSVRGIVELADSSIAVLDGGWRKIVIFSRNGDLERVIPVPEGEGPGEVLLPRDLAVSPNGNLGVLDYVRRRVVWYDQGSGELEGATPLPVTQPLRVRATSDGLWVTAALLSGSGGPVALHVSFEGGVMEQLPPRDAEEIGYTGTVFLAVDARGRPLIPYPVPGRWTYWGSSNTSRRGIELVEPFLDDTGPSVAVMGIAEFQTELVFLTWATVSSAEPPVFKRYLAAFDFGGNLIGVMEGDMVGSELFVSAESGNLFMAYDAPFPHIKELRFSGADSH